MIAPDKIAEIFCIADDFCKEFDKEIKKTSASGQRDVSPMQ